MDGMVKVWDIKNSRFLRGKSARREKERRRGKRIGATAIAYSKSGTPMGSCLVVGRSDGGVVLMDDKRLDWKEKTSFTQDTKSRIRDIKISPDGSQIAAASDDGTWTGKLVLNNLVWR